MADMIITLPCAILGMRPVSPVKHGPQGLCSQGAPNMKAGIQYSNSLPTPYDCCLRFTAIHRLCLQQEKHITGAGDI